jgi:hypothetical protein
MVPPDKFSLLATGRVTRELRTTGDPVMDRAKRIVANNDAKGNMIDRCSQ